ncbi:MAG: response regulator [Pirellulaceae bacterium]
MWNRRNGIGEQVQPLAIIVLTIFGSQLAIMLVLEVIGNPSQYPLFIAAIDAICVALVSAVLIWRLTIQPLWQTHQTFEKLALVASHCQHGVVIADAETRIEWVNEAFEHLTGFTRQEVIGLRAGAFLHGPRTDPETLRLVRQGLQARESIAVEIINYTKNGREFWNLLKISPVHNEAGELIHFVGTQTDISERKLAEELMVRARQAADRANWAKSEFLASMSHELRTPLNGILGMNDLLQHTELTANQSKYVDACATSGKLLLQLINDVLDLSKIEAGKLELNPRECSIEAFTYDVITVFSHAAKQKGLKLLCHLDPQVCVRAHWDDHRLRQILVNLIGNAIKFTSTGSVTLRVQCRPTDDSRTIVRFSVTDTGIGIPQEKCGGLFSPFSQADGFTSRQFGGTGLGLAISKQLVELMGGNIGVESELAAGSTFWFEIPLTFVSGGTEADKPRQLLCGARVLAIDGIDRDRRQIRDCLSAWGCPVHQVTTLREACTAVEHSEAAGTPFAVVFADRRLAEGDDCQLLQELSERPHLAIIGLGADEESDAAGNLRRLGVLQLLSDPVLPSSLFDAMASALSLSVPSPTECEASVEVANEPLAPLQGHILVAEDNGINRLYIVELLTRFGCTSDLAGNGEEALDAVQRRHYDLVLMDCQMPEMDGFQATREIRKREASGDLSGRISIIALTANALKGDREYCLAAGMDDYVSKPVEPSTMREALARFLD